VHISNNYYQRSTIQIDEYFIYCCTLLEPSSGNAINSATQQTTAGSASLNMFSSSNALANNQVSIRYLVIKRGWLHYPVIGDIHIVGFDNYQAREE